MNRRETINHSTESRTQIAESAPRTASASHSSPERHTAHVTVTVAAVVTLTMTVALIVIVVVGFAAEMGGDGALRTGLGVAGAAASLEGDSGSPAALSKKDGLVGLLDTEGSSGRGKWGRETLTFEPHGHPPRSPTHHASSGARQQH